MQGIVKNGSLNADGESIRSNAGLKFATICIGTFLLCFIPYVHIGVIGYFIWAEKPLIDRNKCSCTCFDTVFRGSYESQPGESYKHWYFNATFVAYKMWCLLMVGVIIAYECFKFIVRCIAEKNIRYSMLLLFGATIFPHYYGWWNYLNYYNEEFNWHWYHQLYFTVSELVSTGFVLHMMKKSRPVQTYHILVILSINLSHIIIGGVDQFVANIFYGAGRTSQVVRDFGLVVPDILATLLAVYEAAQLAKRRGESIKSLFDRREILIFVIATTTMVVVGQNL